MENLVVEHEGDEPRRDVFLVEHRVDADQPPLAIEGAESQSMPSPPRHAAPPSQCRRRKLLAVDALKNSIDQWCGQGLQIVHGSPRPQPQRPRGLGRQPLDGCRDPRIEAFAGLLRPPAVSGPCQEIPCDFLRSIHEKAIQAKRYLMPLVLEHHRARARLSPRQHDRAPEPFLEKSLPRDFLRDPSRTFAGRTHGSVPPRRLRSASARERPAAESSCPADQPIPRPLPSSNLGMT